MSNKLINKTKKSLKWTMVQTLFNSVVQPFYRIILALLLIPSEYAYISVILLIVSFAELLNNVGIGEAVIQRENVTKKDLSSLFFFNLLITIFIAGVLYFSSTLIESYYSMDNLALIVKYVTIIVLINGSTSLFKFYLHKEFFFKETSIINIIKITIEIILVTTLILLGKGILGFVLGVVISNIINGILITFIVLNKTNFRINWYFSLKNLLHFLNFGTLIAAKRILNFFSHRIDEIIIGGILTPEILGSYYLAKNILFQLQTLITTSFGQVLLPMFSKIKHDYVKLKHYYLKIMTIIALAGFPLFSGIIITADLFVPVIFGQEWAESIIVFKMLSLSILAILLSAGISTSLLYSVNKAGLLLKIDMIVISIYVLILMMLNNGELINILIIYTTYVFVKFIIIQYFIGSIFNIKAKYYFFLWKGTILSTIIMIISVAGFITLFDQVMNDLILLIASIILGIIIYSGVNILINRKQFFEALKIIKGTLKK